MSIGFVEGINSEALRPGHSEIAEGFVVAVSLAVVIGEYLDHLSEAVATAAFDLLGDLQMQHIARTREQALIESFANERVLEGIVARLSFGIYQTECLYPSELGIDIAAI